MEMVDVATTNTTGDGGTSRAFATESGIAVSYADRHAKSRSWKYQTCSEYGYYQRGNPEYPHTIRSRFLSSESFQHDCDSTFPDIIPPSPNVLKVLRYGGWKMHPSNTMWTPGEFDPWRALSPASTEQDAPDRRSVRTIYDSGVPPPDDEIFGIVYEGMVHVADLQMLPGTAKAFRDGVSLFQEALEKWLPNFKSH
ncbi:hypothetical protein E4T39_06071 [Aureobasidium subglaciale]|nr:hypothetical protein E4T39_06071 [Aureobasidium subglaciale]